MSQIESNILLICLSLTEEGSIYIFIIIYKPSSSKPIQPEFSFFCFLFRGTDALHSESFATVSSAIFGLTKQNLEREMLFLYCGCECRNFATSFVPLSTFKNITTTTTKPLIPNKFG
jgi:hypothetical protein